MRVEIVSKFLKEEKMKLVVGLGNPSGKYDRTRHNLGFDLIDLLADKYRIKVSEKKFHALIGNGIINGEKVILMKPQTYMNESGISVREALMYYKLDVSNDVLIIADDITLDPGRIRIRLKGSAGGHNGLKSIIYQTESDAFTRIKVGAGMKHEGQDLADHVLSPFSRADRELVDNALKDAMEAAELIIEGNESEAMNRFNGKKD